MYVFVSYPPQTNSTLEVLDLSWNGFGFEGCVAVAHMLQYNITLVELDLTNNRISPHALLELLKGLENNKKLATLRVTYHTPHLARTTKGLTG